MSFYGTLVNPFSIDLAYKRRVIIKRLLLIFYSFFCNNLLMRFMQISLSEQFNDRVKVKSPIGSSKFNLSGI